MHISIRKYHNVMVQYIYCNHTSPLLKRFNNITVTLVAATVTVVVKGSGTNQPERKLADV